MALHTACPLGGPIFARKYPLLVVICYRYIDNKPPHQPDGWASRCGGSGGHLGRIWGGIRWAGLQLNSFIIILRIVAVGVARLNLRFLPLPARDLAAPLEPLRVPDPEAGIWAQSNLLAMCKAIRTAEGSPDGEA